MIPLNDATSSSGIFVPPVQIVLRGVVSIPSSYFRFGSRGVFLLRTDILQIMHTELERSVKSFISIVKHFIYLVNINKKTPEASLCSDTMISIISPPQYLFLTQLIVYPLPCPVLPSLGLFPLLSWQKRLLLEY